MHVALTRIARRELPGLDPDAALGTVLGPVAEDADSLDELERALALEEDLPNGLGADGAVATTDIWPGAVLSALLGPAARQCRWDPSTLWTRSMRGVVNERVRWRGGCTCGLEATATR